MIISKKLFSQLVIKLINGCMCVKVTDFKDTLRNGWLIKNGRNFH